MGKTSKKVSKKVEKEDDDQPLESLENEIYESDLVKMKKENAKKFDAHLKKTQKLVQDRVDSK